MGLSLKNIGKKIFDQVNPFDNGRTFQNQTPTNNRSVVGQLTHNAVTNNIGNLGVKPITSLPSAFFIEPARSTLASITSNQSAMQAAEQRKNASLDRTLPGYIANQSFNVGKLPVDLFKQTVGDITSNPIASRNANTAVFRDINATPIGQLTNIPQRNAADWGARHNNPTLPENLQKQIAAQNLNGIGVDPNASLGKQITDTASGAAQLYGFVKGIRNKAEIPQEGTPLPPTEGPPKITPTPEKMPVKLAGQGSVSLPEVKLSTSLPKGSNFPRKVFTSVRGELSRMGTGGKEIANRLQQWRTGSELGQQAFLDSIPTVQKLGKEFPQFVDALDSLSRGNTPQMSAKVAQAVKEWSANITKVQEAAVSAGKDVGNRGPFYFPRQYTELLKTRNGFNAAVNHLVSSGQAANAAEAIQQLRYIKGGKDFGHFKAREFDIPGYDKNQTALTRYLNGAFNDISAAQQFGAKGEVGSQLISRIAQEGHDAARAQRNLDIALGNTDKSGAGYKVSGKIRQFNSLRSLGTAGVSNATQLPVNTGTIAGIGRTLKGAAKYVASKEERAKVRQSGVLLDSAIENLAGQELGTTGKITRNIAAPFFRQIEKFNRGATATVASDWGNSLAAKVAKGDTKAEGILRDKLGVTGEIGSRLTREQEIQAGRALVERAQFKVDPQDLPGWVDSPTGKLVAQFRTFGYKQTDFMYNEVLREAVKGNFKPLARFIAVGVPAGATSQYIKSNLKASKYTAPNESKGTEALKALAAVGGGGLVSDAAQNLYKSAQYGNTVGGIAGTFGGPTASFIAETSANIDKAVQGKKLSPLEKQAVRTIPAAGPYLANKAFPKATQTVANSSGTPEEKKAAATKELAGIKAKAGEGYQLQQLSDGRYAYNLNGDVSVSKDLKAAQQAIAKDSFKNSDATSKTVGDTYYYKTKNGDVKTQPQILHQYDQTVAKVDLQLDRAYRAGDLNSWLQSAQQKYDALEAKKQYYDPTTEADKITTLTNQQEDLLYKAQGYQEKGIGGGSAKKSAGSAYKYAISPNAGGSVARPKVSVRSVATTVSRRATGSKPKVAIKRSLA